MCGRFVSAADLEAVAAYFDTPLPGFDARRSYNVAPSSDIVAVVGNDDGRRIESFRWGLVPPWSKDPAKGPPLFNARSETAATKNSFRGPFKRRRCLVPADGFYEWPRVPKGTRGTGGDERPLPHYITRADGDMLAMAGLWERWWPPQPDADPAVETPLSVLHSATVLTVSANSFMAPIHDRMPVLLERSQWEAWLDPANDDVEALSAMCIPAGEGILRSHEVGRAVGNVRNNDASLIEPAEADRLF